MLTDKDKDLIIEDEIQKIKSGFYEEADFRARIREVYIEHDGKVPDDIWKSVKQE